METHLDLICEQLDTLLNLLQRESRLLHDWVDTHLENWDQDDYQSLIQRVETIAADFIVLPQEDLHTQLYDIREFAAVLLHSQNLDRAQQEQLQLIHLTSADLLDIVEEIAVR